MRKYSVAEGKRNAEVRERREGKGKDSCNVEEGRKKE